jgi:DNA-binding helix-turn-helix protein
MKKLKFIVDKSKVGSRIFDIRQSMNLTLEEFGNLFQAGKSNVQKWEIGSSLPTRERLDKIAKKGNMTVNELLYGSIDEFLENNLDTLVKNNEFLTLPDTEQDNFINFLKNTSEVNVKDIEKFISNFDILLEKFIREVILVNIENNIDVLKSKKELAIKFLNQDGWFNSANNNLLKKLHNLLLSKAFLIAPESEYEKFDNYKVLLSILELPNNDENIELKLFVYDMFHILLSNIKANIGIKEPNLIEESILYFSLENITKNDIDLYSEEIANLTFFFKDIHITPNKYNLPEYNFLIGLNIEDEQSLYFLANYWEIEGVPLNKEAKYFILNHDNTYQISKITEIPNCKYIAPIIGKLE